MKNTFRFPLQRLLHLRERNERDAAVHLAAARNAEGEIAGAQSAAAAERADARATLMPKPGEARGMADLRNASMVMDRMDQRLSAMADQLVKAELETAKSHNTLVGRVRDRRVLERLRERLHAEWRVESDRRERDVMDAARPRAALADDTTSGT